ncbi:MAG TPA: nucleotide sugar dehydrogenase [Solirubrobacteraceae bacterium]|nr:nucleotide sugar dehydrogenase [Solirubrobacteraceae bacterium]
MRAVVVALGKIGLPIAVQIARAGHEVVGCDIDAHVVAQVNDAVEPFPGEAGLAEALAEVVGAGRLRAATDTTAAVAEGADLVVAVPPLVVGADAQPDFAVLDAVVAAIGAGLRARASGSGSTSGSAPTTVSIETTLPVGTTRGRVAPALAAASGLRSEQDFFTVHSPERVYSGRIFADLRTYPKLVGGLSEAGEARASELYRSFLEAEVRGMGGAEAAELTKLAETTYRDVNIALANEFAAYADSIGVDVDRVIDAANSQPFSHIHRPGIAVGGHCIPVYPRFYLAGDETARLAGTAREVNEAMPAYAVRRLADALGGRPAGLRVLVLGAAYRGGVKETAFSGAFGVVAELERRGATPFVSDPLFSADELTALELPPWDGEPVDALVVQADHGEYRALTPGDFPGVRAVLDGRGILDPTPWREAGVPLLRIGRP